MSPNHVEISHILWGLSKSCPVTNMSKSNWSWNSPHQLLQVMFVDWAAKPNWKEVSLQWTPMPRLQCNSRVNFLPHCKTRWSKFVPATLWTQLRNQNQRSQPLEHCIRPFRRKFRYHCWWFSESAVLCHKRVAWPHGKDPVLRHASPRPLRCDQFGCQPHESQTLEQKPRHPDGFCLWGADLGMFRLHFFRLACSFWRESSI